MQTSAVRIDKESDEILQEIAEKEKVPKGKIIRKALIDYRRKYFLKKCAEAYYTIKSDKKLWKDEISEREDWDSTIGDGLEEDK